MSTNDPETTPEEPPPWELIFRAPIVMNNSTGKRWTLEELSDILNDFHFTNAKLTQELKEERDWGRMKDQEIKNLHKVVDEAGIEVMRRDDPKGPNPRDTILRDLRDALGRRDKTIAALQADLDLERSETEADEEVIKDLVVKFEKAEARVEATQRTVDALTSECHALKLNPQRPAFNIKEIAGVDDLQNQIRDRDDEIESLKKALRAAQSKVKEMAQQMKLHRDTRMTLGQTNHDLQGELLQACQRIATLEAALAKAKILEERFRNAEARLAKVQARVEGRDQQQDDPCLQTCYPTVAAFRKRPVIVSATRCYEAQTISTLQGPMPANRGDWIITGVQGERYLRKDSIFRQYYEPANRAGLDLWSKENP